ncbi:MAG: lysylphosphatidylglycerol synthase transmembrane domain-containing protein [Candidatus Bathyarchaeia archaeon]
MRGRPKFALVLQIFLGFLLIVGIVWYVGAHEIGHVLLRLDVMFLVYALAAYFFMNLLFAVRLKMVLKALGQKLGLKKILPVQYGGMLASDFTPARSGYFVVPLMLASEEIPLTVGLSSILGIQSIEFLVKMMGGVFALIYLVQKFDLGMDLLIISSAGVGLMLVGAIIIFLAMWWKKAVDLLNVFEKVPFLGRLVTLVSKKITEFQVEAYRVKDAVIPITSLTLVSWFVKGLEWYFIGLALNITQISFMGFFLLHPLITALSFVPITPSGIGFQEGGIVGVFYLLGVKADVSVVFALLARFLLVIEDVVGVPALSRAGVKVFEIVSNLKEKEVKQVQPGSMESP